MFHLISPAQDSLNIDFGKFSISDFEHSYSKLDSSSGAIIIADIGKSFFWEDRTVTKHMFTRFMRVKILNANGFHIADYRFVLPKYGNGKTPVDSIFSLKASTFTLENGIVKETKLDRESIYDESVGKYIDIKKFAMPALKVGAIYDIAFTIRIPMRVPIRSWDFQSDYPCLWSEYQVTIPPYLNYAVKYQGDTAFDITTSKYVSQTFSVINKRRDGRELRTGDGVQFRWVKKDVASIGKEVYVNSTKNYISHVSFKLLSVQYGNISERVDVKKSWSDISSAFLSNSNLSNALESNNDWIEKDINKSIKNSPNSSDLIREIYFFVRNNFECNDHRGIYARRSLWDIYKSRSGNVAEINLVLYFMLRQYNIISYPAVLSTSENGLPDFENPNLDDYNYLICVAQDGEKEILLDASWPKNPFGQLLTFCYNGGGARVLNDGNTRIIPLTSDSLIEKSLTNVFILNDDSGKVSGTFSKVYGTVESYDIRGQIQRATKKEYFAKLANKITNNVGIENEDIDSLENCEYPIAIHCDLGFKDSFKSDLEYFTPIIDSLVVANPFVSVDRRFPVQMPYKRDDVYLLSMDIPKGYKVEEFPASARFKLNGDQGLFEYVIQKNEDNIQMQVHLKFNKTEFSTDEYSGLREFYSDIIKKEREQIIFKKIK